MSATLSPKFITFDMLGTLTNFQLAPIVSAVLEGVVPPEDHSLLRDHYSSYREDEVIGVYKPYPQVIRDSWQRTCNRWRIQFRQSDVDQMVAAIPTWGPHADVVEPLKRLAEKYPLVILTNHSDDLAHQNVEKLGVEFYRVFTAEQAQAYKPRLRAFEYMIDQLDAKPSELLHVSAHIWYDVIPATAMGITEIAYIDHGDEALDFPGIRRTTLAGVADLVGA
jgi:2-haloacid dehalogenase